MSLACILGCAGPVLTAEEAAFFSDVQPWGFILFGRNVATPDQVRTLVADLRACVGRPEAPVLIDQEGGRVARLGPPHWPRFPAGRAYGDLDRIAPGEGVRLASLGGRLIAHELAALGVNVDCAPVLDTPSPGAHDIIGDRAYADAPAAVAELGRAFAQGLLAGGVLPVVKHIPGHGRAAADSHLELPVVAAGLADLAARDFAPFKALADLPMAMTAHVVYAAVDPLEPATTSRAVIDTVIRGTIGFDGLLISDDLSMRALGGDFAARARRALDAGCDIVLHCNGAMDEMTAVVAGARPLAGRAARRAAAALARLAPPAPFDAAAGRARLRSGHGRTGGRMSEALAYDLDFDAALSAVELSEDLILDLDGFEGPLHVLLALARTQKVDLLKLSITRAGRPVPGLRAPGPPPALRPGGRLSGDGRLAGLPEVAPAAAQAERRRRRRAAGRGGRRSAWPSASPSSDAMRERGRGAEGAPDPAPRRLHPRRPARRSRWSPTAGWRATSTA